MGAQKLDLEGLLHDYARDQQSSRNLLSTGLFPLGAQYRSLSYSNSLLMISR